LRWSGEPKISNADLSLWPYGSRLSDWRLGRGRSRAGRGRRYTSDSRNRCLLCERFERRSYGLNDDFTLISSDAAFGSGQLCGVESELFADPLHHARIENLARAAKRNLCFSTFPVYCHHSQPCMPPVMLAMIDASPLLHQPFSKSGAFHFSTPVELRRWRRAFESNCDEPSRLIAQVYAAAGVCGFCIGRHIPAIRG
jgi:hypothetical protein